jgi:hypothetical protein
VTGLLDSRLATMRVYQQVLNMGRGAQDQLESALGCTCEEAFVVLTGRVVRGLRTRPRKCRETWRGDRPFRTKKPRNCGLFGERLKGFGERLMGFEPTTFCMVSSSYGTGHRKEPPANAGI